MLLHWLKQAVLAGASDLHLSAGRRPTLRHLGDIVPLAAALVTREEAQSMAQQVLQWLACLGWVAFGPTSFSTPRGMPWCCA